MRRSFRPIAAALLLAALAACGSGPKEPAGSAAGSGRRPVLFVGLDGADWQLLDGYLAEGAMPNLAALVREGRSGVLTTLHPPLSPLIWTTIATGVGPLEHGILDFTRFDPATGARGPITSADRRVPAVWNMASAAGRSVAVFGLWATWPAEPVRGLVVSDRMFSFQRVEEPPPGAVFPAEREGWAREALAAAEGEVDLEALRTYLPWLDETGYERLAGGTDPWARPVSGLRRLLVETNVHHRLATDWIVRERPDLAIVYFQGTDAVGHLFAPYAPPRRPEVSAEDFARYSEVPRRYFAHVDRLLGDYRRLAEGSGAVLVLASDHGFHWGEGRPHEAASAAAATAGRWHRDEGIYVLWGPGISPQAERGRGGGVAQVCATLLALLGLPPGKGLAGPPLAGLPPAARRPEVDYRAGWRPAPPPAAIPSEGTAEEELAKLRALGYLGAKEAAGEAGARPAGASSLDPTRTAGSYNNEGLILREAGRAAEAVRAFERATALDPANASALWNLSDLLFVAGGDPDRAADLLARAAAAGLPDGAGRVLARAAEHRRRGESERGARLLEAAAAALPTDPALRLARGRHRLEREDCRGALDDFREAARLRPADPLAWGSSALARLCLGDREGAAGDLRHSLALDPDQPELRQALAGL